MTAATLTSARATLDVCQAKVSPIIALRVEGFIEQWRQGLLRYHDIGRTQDLHDLYVEWCHVNRESTLSETKFSLFVSTKVPKTSNTVFWRDDSGTRRRSMLFVPDINRDGLPPFSDSRAMGDAIRRWRRAAYWAGWSVDSWAKCIGFVAPMEAERPKEVA